MEILGFHWAHDTWCVRKLFKSAGCAPHLFRTQRFYLTADWLSFAIINFLNLSFSCRLLLRFLQARFMPVAAGAAAAAGGW